MKISAFPIQRAEDGVRKLQRDQQGGPFSLESKSLHIDRWKHTDVCYRRPIHYTIHSHASRYRQTNEYSTVCGYDEHTWIQEEKNDPANSSISALF